MATNTEHGLIEYLPIDGGETTDTVTQYDVNLDGNLVANLEKNDVARWIVEYGAFFAKIETFSSEHRAKEWIEENIAEIANAN